MRTFDPFSFLSQECHKTDQENPFDFMVKGTKLLFEQMMAAQNLVAGFSKYNSDFWVPFLLAATYFGHAEASRISKDSPEEVLESYKNLFEFNMALFERSFSGSLSALEGYSQKELQPFIAAFCNSLFQCRGEKLDQFLTRQFKMLEGVVKLLPEAIHDIEPEYGFHFERNENPLFAETERFKLYRIEPNIPGVNVNEKAKPLLIIPPFVLGSNILCFLPLERRSYAHCYANQGIPTYIRIMKEIGVTPECQTMTLEDDARDTRYFCEKIMAQHGKKVTLNGYCQGGYSAVCNILSGELDDVVDALITCVAPMDGTRSKGLGDFLNHLPPRFNDLVYGTKTLANGNKVADGKLMGWVYKLKSIENETPLVSFLRDMFMVARSEVVSKTAAALNYWLQRERTDIPLSVTRMSFASYNIPVTDDGTLPVKLFGRPLNFKRIAEKKMPWLLCYGEQDDLVEKETALAPLDYVDVEVAPFPKGHVAIATSWSHPDSDFALHTRFGRNNYRGPVRFQLDLDASLDVAKKKPQKNTGLSVSPVLKADKKTAVSPPKKSRKIQSKSSIAESGKIRSGSSLVMPSKPSVVKNSSPDSVASKKTSAKLKLKPVKKQSRVSSPKKKAGPSISRKPKKISEKPDSPGKNDPK